MDVGGFGKVVLGFGGAASRRRRPPSIVLSKTSGRNRLMPSGSRDGSHHARNLRGRPSEKDRLPMRC